MPGTYELNARPVTPRESTGGDEGPVQEPCYGSYNPQIRWDCRCCPTDTECAGHTASRADSNTLPWPAEIERLRAENAELKTRVAKLEQRLASVRLTKRHRCTKEQPCMLGEEAMHPDAEPTDGPNADLEYFRCPHCYLEWSQDKDEPWEAFV